MKIDAGLHRLRQKTMYSLLPVYCLPETFTHGQLLEATEIILGQPIQRKSLIRRFEASGMFEETGETAATGARKARLWRRKPGVDNLLMIESQRIAIQLRHRHPAGIADAGDMRLTLYPRD